MQFYNDDKVSIEASSYLFKKIGGHDPKTISKVLLQGKRHPLLCLDRNNLGDEGIIPIFRALKQNAIVESLDISSNNLTATSIGELCQALTSNKYIKYLKLENNGIGDSGAEKLANVIKNNGCSLKGLYLSDCQITSKGCSILALALESNTLIATLHLNSNPIGNEGISQLVKSLYSNSSIKSISCFFCSISDVGATRVIEYLEAHKKSISNLNIKGNKISPDNQEKINKLLLVKKIKEKKRLLKMEAKELINQEAERMVKIKMKDVNEKAKKQLDEKQKVLEKREEDLVSKEKVLNTKQTEISAKIKEFENKSKKTKDPKNEKSTTTNSHSSKNTSGVGKKKKNDSDTITIIIAGDKDKDKEVLLGYGQTVIDNIKVISDTDFEKTINGDVVIEGKSVNITFVNTSSNDRYSRLRALQYEHADAAMVVYTASDRVSFEDISFQWLPEINFMGKMPIFITSMQSDQRTTPPNTTDVSEQEGKEFAEKIGSANLYYEPLCAEDFRKMVTSMIKELSKKKKK
ncbi:leucine-rich repeat-containing protein [Cavenderia fasciculata]|uniref:Leucine-rich repeat-containing protein n=1 Tax=Cavenderia fasciculata TaxID=261658 RepID=F4Q8J6_CACFS|nr:leucine-rich repeat-containing protein [Cavenderia fasciculata]EGG16096.1 leucine-rich repeat-containing protein [Cavenderia fasciculata]|eukprot:XP_004352421.1 leucine-rich repeat-containing protein [Cavenderia fasciculata]